MNTKAKGFGFKALSPMKQAELARFWDERLKDPLAFVPKEDKAKGLSITEARMRNVLFGKFAVSYFKKIIARMTDNSDFDRRRFGNKKIMAVGYGRGYDSRWLQEATKAGFQTWWVDVSPVAWIWAISNLRNQFDAMPQPIQSIYQESQVKTFEIQSLLADPSKAGLKLGSVDIWYLCRLLNCLSTPSAKVVLQEIGRTAFSKGQNTLKRKAVVIINALSDQNPVDTCDTCGGTSIRRSKRMILSNLARGAGCPVEARFVKHYNYFGKIVTAMTVMAM